MSYPDSFFYEKNQLNMLRSFDYSSSDRHTRTDRPNLKNSMYIEYVVCLRAEKQKGNETSFRLSLMV